MNSRERDGWLDRCKLVRLLEGVVMNLVYNSKQISSVTEIVCFLLKTAQQRRISSEIGSYFLVNCCVYWKEFSKIWFIILNKFSIVIEIVCFR